MDIIGIAALAVGVVALGVCIAMEALKRPRLTIVNSKWPNPSFVPWTFATVRVRNEPLAPPLRNLLTRQSAQACKAEIEFYRWDSTAPFLRLPGRWSAVPQPLSLVPSSLAGAPIPASGGTVYTPVDIPVTGGTAPTTFPFDLASGGAAALTVIPPSSGKASGRSGYKVVYDPARDLGRRNVAVSSGEEEEREGGEEIAVAILRGGEAFAFSTESYKHPSWGNPEWRLERGNIYRIIVRVRGSGVQRERAFRLEYLTNNPSEFWLQAID